MDKQKLLTTIQINFNSYKEASDFAKTVKSKHISYFVYGYIVTLKIWDKPL